MESGTPTHHQHRLGWLLVNWCGGSHMCIIHCCPKLVVVAHLPTYPRCCRAKEIADMHERLSGKLTPDGRLEALVQARTVLRAVSPHNEAFELVEREMDLLNRCAKAWERLRCMAHVAGSVVTGLHRKP